MTQFVLTSCKRAVDDKVQIIYFAPKSDGHSYRHGAGVRLAIRISVNGRMVGVSYKGKMLHDRVQRLEGGKRIRLPSDKVRRFRDIACAAIAFVALGYDVERFPPQEFDL